MSLLKKIDTFFIKIQEYILLFSSVAICCLIFAAAFARYILQTDLYGSEEIIMLIAFWLYFIGSSLAERYDAHISADMVNIFVKNATAKKLLALLKFIISISVALIITKWSFDYVQRSFMLNPKSPVLKMPLVFTQLPILISFILMDIYIVRNFIELFRKNESEVK